jgi:hypothetical protein
MDIHTPSTSAHPHTPCNYSDTLYTLWDPNRKKCHSDTNHNTRGLCKINSFCHSSSNWPNHPRKTFLFCRLVQCSVHLSSRTICIVWFLGDKKYLSDRANTSHNYSIHRVAGTFYRCPFHCKHHSYQCISHIVHSKVTWIFLRDTGMSSSTS